MASRYQVTREGRIKDVFTGLAVANVRDPSLIDAMVGLGLVDKRPEDKLPGIPEGVDYFAYHNGGTAINGYSPSIRRRRPGGHRHI